MPTIEDYSVNFDASGAVTAVQQLIKALADLNRAEGVTGDKAAELAKKYNIADQGLQKWMHGVTSAEATTLRTTGSISKGWAQAQQSSHSATVAMIQDMRTLSNESEKTRQQMSQRWITEAMMPSGVMAGKRNLGALPLNINPEAQLAAESRLQQAQAARMQQIFAAGQEKMAPIVDSTSVARTIENTRKLARSTDVATKSVQRLTFSWRMAIRIFESFVIYRGLYMIGDILRSATVAAVEFEIKISQIRTISQRSQLTFSEWAVAVRKLSDEFGNPLIDVGAGTYEVVSNQIAEGAKAVEFMRDAQKLALVTFASTKDSVSALTGIMNAYGLSTNYTENLSAKLFKTIDVGRVNMADLAGTIGDVSSIAALLGVSIDELLAAISAITIRSVNPRNALTQLRNIFSQLLKPSTDMKESLNELGYTSAEQLLRVNDLSGALQKLVSVKPDMQGLAEIFRNIRGYAGVAILTKDTKTFLGDINEIKNSTQDYLNALRISVESNGKQMQIEVNKIKNYFTTELGQTILEWAVLITKNFGGLTVIVKTLAHTVELILLPALAALAWQLNKLRTVMAGHPLIVLAGLVATAAVAIKIMIDLNSERQEAAAEAEKNAWEEVTRRRIANYGLLLEEAAKTMIAEEKLAGKAAAAVIAGINATQKAAMAGAKELDTQVELILKETMDSVRENLKVINQNINESEARVKKMTKALQDLKAESQQRSVAEKIEDKKPVDQIKVLREEITALMQQGREATTFEDMEMSFKNALKYADDIKTLTKQTEKDRNKVEKEITKSHKEYERTETRLRKEQKRKPREREEIEKNRRLLKESYEKTFAELNDKFIEIGTVPLTTEQVNNAIKNIIRQQAAAIKSFREKDAILVAKNTTAQSKQQQFENEIVAVQRRLKDQDFSKLIAQENIENVKKEFAERRFLQSSLTDLLMRLPVTIAGENALAALLKQMDIESKAVIGRIEADKLAIIEKEKDAQSKILLERYKALQEEAQIVEQNLAKAQRNRIVGEQEYQKLIKERGLEEVVKTYQTGGYDPIGMASVQKLLSDLREQAYLNVGLSPFAVDVSLQRATQKQLSIREQIGGILSRSPAVATMLMVTEINTVKTGAVKFKETLVLADEAFISFNATLAKYTQAVADAAAAIQRIVPLVPQIPNGPVPAVAPVEKAFGGMVSRGTDSILALLSPGEFVVNAQSARRYYSQLVAMNTAIPGFAAGGPVTNVTGDFNINMHSSGNATADVQEIGRLLRREIRRGTVSLR